MPKFGRLETPPTVLITKAVSPICHQEKTDAQAGGKDRAGLGVLSREVGSGLLSPQGWNRASCHPITT